MNYKPYPTEFWNLIQEKVSQLKSQNKKLIAAFDADGTLWDADLGENFFQYQIGCKSVPLPPNAFDHYLDMKKINDDPQAAFMWLAQINKGCLISDVNTWAQKAFNQILPNPLFSEQKKLVELLLKNDVKIYIVTASIKWAVVPGALALGLTADDVIGVETEINDQFISDIAIHPITYKQGKVLALLNKTNGELPFLCSGNSMGDFELLKSATEVKLVVSAASADDPNYRTEMELIYEAKKNNWNYHRFI